jgi:hypothetical protein
MNKKDFPYKTFKFLRNPFDVMEKTDKMILYLEVLEKTRSNKKACEAVPCHPSTIARWRKEDKEFNEEILLIGEQYVEMAEDVNYTLMKNFMEADKEDENYLDFAKLANDASKTALKMKGKSKGWNESKQLDISEDDKNINIQMEFINPEKKE